MKVCKFGGSSLSDGRQFAKVKSIIESDPDRSIVVVSAPGRRFSKDTKVTDLLYLSHAHLKYDVPFDNVIEMIKERYTAIKDECHLSFDIEGEIDQAFEGVSKKTSVDYIASRGEYLNALLMAEYLGFRFVDAADWMTFKYDGSVDFAKTEEKLKDIVGVYGHIVTPGFYGCLPSGDVKVFSRGGSDITGAIAAASIDAEMYENWTDVSGILMTDPRIVDNPHSIPRVTYAELREMSYMGASVLHEDTVFPVRNKDIPVNIRNTNLPEAPGTIIRERFEENNDIENKRFITGITGVKDFSIVNIYKSHLENKIALLRKVLGICEKFGVSVENIPGGVDCFSLVVPTRELKSVKYDFLSALREECTLDDAYVTDGISLIAIVGRQMAYRTGISGKIFAALGENGINIRTIEQSSDEISILVGVYTEDFNKAIRVLYDSFAR